MPTEDLMNYIQQIVTVLSIFCIVFIIRAWRNWQTTGLASRSIPSRGSFGWPIIGETLSVSRCAGNFTMERWLRERTEKYGTMFKSHLFFKPSIVMTTAEQAKFVYDDPHKQMRSGAPDAMRRIFGGFSIFSLDGKEHRYVYKILSDSLLMPAMKPKAAEFDKLMRHSLSSWDGQVDFLGAMEKIIFKIMTFHLFGIPWGGEMADRLATLLHTFVQGATSIPFYFPGTVFYKSSNARKAVDQILLPIIRELRSAESGGSSDFASSDDKFPYQKLLNCELNGVKISDTGVADILLSPVLAGGQATSTIVALAIYHLTNNPSMLQEALAEVDRIRKRKEKLGETDLSVSDLKDLKYLTQVFNEVLRITTIVPGGGRVAKDDIHFDGQVIPKGWFIMAPIVLIHMDPETYPEPSKFNPDRFETPANPGKFMPFGRGNRACVGRDFSRLVILMALYHILSDFTWDIVSCSGQLKYLPVVEMIGGFELFIKPRIDLP